MSNKAGKIENPWERPAATPNASPFWLMPSMPGMNSPPLHKLSVQPARQARNYCASSAMGVVHPKRCAVWRSCPTNHIPFYIHHFSANVNNQNFWRAGHAGFGVPDPDFFLRCSDPVGPSNIPVQIFLDPPESLSL